MSRLHAAENAEESRSDGSLMFGVKNVWLRKHFLILSACNIFFGCENSFDSKYGLSLVGVKKNCDYV